MIWADLAIFAIIALSIVVGLWRGFIKEVFALAVWVAAIVLAFQFSGVLAELLVSHVSLPSARTGIAFTGIFILVLVVGGLLTYLLGKLVKSTGLSGTDRLLGSVFGLVRGVALVLLVILVCGFTPIPSDPWWSDSRALQSMLPLAEWVSGFLPEQARELLDFHPEAEVLPT